MHLGEQWQTAAYSSTEARSAAHQTHCWQCVGWQLEGCQPLSKVQQLGLGVLRLQVLCWIHKFQAK